MGSSIRTSRRAKKTVETGEPLVKHTVAEQLRAEIVSGAQAGEGSLREPGEENLA